LLRNETFTYTASAATTKMYVWIHDHKTLGKDKLLGLGEVDVRTLLLDYHFSLIVSQIWRHIRPQGQSSAEVLLDLKEGHGLVTLRLEFDATAIPRAASISSGNSPIASPSRFSLSRRRAQDADSD
jgi:hypothetical protein